MVAIGSGGIGGGAARPTGGGRGTPKPVAADDLVAAILTASRVMVAVAARAMALATDEITLTQYRALTVLDQRGPVQANKLARTLEVSPSTVTRLCDRLIQNGLVSRTRRDDRRAVLISLTPVGRRLVEHVNSRRFEEIHRIVDQLPSESRPAVIAAIDAFVSAAQGALTADPGATWTL